jgi:hypothetical protein
MDKDVRIQYRLYQIVNMPLFCMNYDKETQDHVAIIDFWVKQDAKKISGARSRVYSK